MSPGTNTEDMTPDEITAWMASDEFAERSRIMNARIEAGEIMTLEGIAHELGLPWLFFAGCLAAEVRRQAPDTIAAISDAGVELH